MWTIMVDHNILIALVSSLLMLILGPLVIDVISVSKKMWRFLSNATKFLAHDDSVVVDYASVDDNPPPLLKPSGVGLTCRDAEIVTSRLGLTGWRCGEAVECQGCEAINAMYELLDDKRVSEGELKEAFYVFDRNEDGFISLAELWNVMRRLGLKEGETDKDCMRMIRAFDEDGDGRISYQEFRSMMENAF